MPSHCARRGTRRIDRHPASVQLARSLGGRGQDRPGSLVHVPGHGEILVAAQLAENLPQPDSHPPGPEPRGQRDELVADAGQRRTRRSSQLVLVSVRAVCPACCTARRSRSLPRRNSSSVRPRKLVSARRKLSAWSRNSARLVSFSGTCSSASRRNPAVANAWHAWSTEG